MPNNKTRRIVLAALLMMLPALPALAASTFKCQDASGKWYYGDKLPPECAKRPNQKLDSQGLKRSEDPGELTVEQRIEEEAKQKAKDTVQDRVRECQRINKALLTTYTKPEEIDAARDDTLQQTEATIRGIRQKISDTQALQVQLQKEADAYKGKKVPQALKDKMDDAEDDLTDNQQLVVSKRKELDTIRKKFAEDKRRYIELTGPNGTEAATCNSVRNAK